MSFQAQVECGTWKKLKVLRTNNGGEFTSMQFGEYCVGEGIQRHYSTPYMPQQNDIIERQNLMVVNTEKHLARSRHARSLLGGGGAHCHLLTQQGAYEHARWDDPVPSLAREEAPHTLPKGVRFYGLHQACMSSPR